MKTKHQTDRNRLQSYCSYIQLSGIHLYEKPLNRLGLDFVSFLNNAVSVVEYDQQGSYTIFKT